jgi:hypothetical protein
MSSEPLADVLRLLVLALATSAISVTITRSGVFLGPRTFIADRSKWFGEMAHCPYCMSHWVSLVLMWWYGLRTLPQTHWSVDLLVTALAVVAVASFFTLLVMLSYKYAALAAGSTSQDAKMLRDGLVKARSVIAKQQTRIKELGG